MKHLIFFLFISGIILSSIVYTIFYENIAKASTIEPGVVVKIIYHRDSMDITRIVDQEMKTICYIIYRSSVGTSMSCVALK